MSRSGACRSYSACPGCQMSTIIEPGTGARKNTSAMQSSRPRSVATNILSNDGNVGETRQLTLRRIMACEPAATINSLQIGSFAWVMGCKRRVDIGTDQGGLGIQMGCMTKHSRHPAVRRFTGRARWLIVLLRCAAGGQRCVSSASGAVSSSASLVSMPSSRDASRLVRIPTFAVSLTTGSSMRPR